MDNLRQYLLRIICASLITAIVTAFSDKKSSTGIAVKIIGTAFLLFAVVSPLIHFDYHGLRGYWDEIAYTAEANTQAGIQIQKDAADEIIKEKTASYILDKASQFHADLQVEVTLSEDTIPYPISVELQGRITPYGKSRLQETISKDLGISKENQRWIG